MNAQPVIIDLLGVLGCKGLGFCTMNDTVYFHGMPPLYDGYDFQFKFISTEKHEDQWKPLVDPGAIGEPCDPTSPTT